MTFLSFVCWLWALAWATIVVYAIQYLFRVAIGRRPNRVPKTPDA